jgi:putative transcriptional regulator
MKINLHIDVMMAKRKIGAGELANRIGITPANLSILKNDRAKAIRFSTLAALCRELDCQPGDLLEFVQTDEPDGAGGAGDADLGNDHIT